MPHADFDASLLSERWTVISAKDEADELEAELAQELPAGHVLVGRTVVAVAIREFRKEVVFRLPGDGLWAWVHLTWTSETDARWPSTVICETWMELVDELRESGRG